MPDKRPKLVWLAHHIPYPVDHGSVVRSFNMLKALSQTFDIHLIIVSHSQVEHKEARDKLGEITQSIDLFWAPSSQGIVKKIMCMLQALCSDQPYMHHRFYDPTIQPIIAKKITDYQPCCIHTDCIGLMGYVRACNAPTILNHHNIESAYHANRAVHTHNPIARFYLKQEAKKIARMERESLQVFDLHLAISEQEKALLLAAMQTTQAPIALMPNGVDTQYYQSKKAHNNERKKIVFLGSLNHPPNLQGLLDFLINLWPAWKKQPVTLTIVGKGSSPMLSLLTVFQPQITLIRNAEDIRIHMSHADCMIIPIQSGGGSMLKMATGMSMGIPIVCYQKAISGYFDDEETARQYAWVATSEKSFQEGIDRCLSEPQWAQAMANRARCYVQQHYDWTVLIKPIVDHYLTLKKQSCMNKSSSPL